MAPMGGVDSAAIDGDAMSRRFDWSRVHFVGPGWISEEECLSFVEKVEKLAEENEQADPPKDVS